MQDQSNVYNNNDNGGILAIVPRRHGGPSKSNGMPANICAYLNEAHPPIFET
jgi:hypothetical protein